MNLIAPAEAERAIVGILAGGASMGDASALTRKDFTEADMADAFAACQSLDTRHEGISLAALDEHLTRDHGSERASVLMAKVVSAMREFQLRKWELGSFVRIVREGSQRRRLIKIGEAIVRGAQDEQRSMEELIDSARTFLTQAVQARGGWIKATDACLAAYEAAERQEIPIQTGVRGLDIVLGGGLHGGELTILGARPAVGKSAVLLQMAMEAARSGKRVCFVSLEMSEIQMGTRILSAKSGVNAALLRTGQDIEDADWELLASGLEIAGQECGDRLSIMASGSMSVEELRSEVQTMVEKGECDLLIVDYLQLLSTRQKTGKEYERIGVVSRGLKAITLDLKIPVVAAAQVLRQNGINRAPTLDELRGSGDIEQDADNVILLHKPDADDESISEPYRTVARNAKNFGMSLMSFDVAKQRQGITSRTFSVFNSSRMRFCPPDDFC